MPKRYTLYSYSRAVVAATRPLTFGFWRIYSLLCLCQTVEQTLIRSFMRYCGNAADAPVVANVAEAEHLARLAAKVRHPYLTLQASQCRDLSVHRAGLWPL